MEPNRVPPPPPPPPPAGGGGSAHGLPMQLPPHLQAMMREVQATLGSQQQQNQASLDQLPMQFGNGHAYGRGGGRGGRGGGGGRGYSNNNDTSRHGRGGGNTGNRGRGFVRGGRGGGRGRGGGGRGSYNQHQSHPQQQQQHYGPMKRKRDFDGNGPARFFVPSCLEDPWLSLLQPTTAPPMAAPLVPVQAMMQPQQATAPCQQQRHQQHQQPRPGRVLYQPSFLQDPWTVFVR